MIGETVLHYRIDGRLGQGGMGVVYRATDLKLLRTVALKFIPDEISHDPDARDRFLREARAASALDHVNVGTIFGVEQAPDGRQFIAMAHYEGETLAKLIARGRLSTGHAADIVRQIAAALNEAHSRGVIHRDIKPSNVILTRQGVAKVVDFGLASLSGSARLTVSGAQMGTPHYMSPEQALGEAVDHRTDLWSLGVVLHEMLTGRSPFHAPSTPAILYRVVHEDVAPEALEALDDPMTAVIGRALKKDPAERFQSARQMALALDGIDEPDEVARNPIATTVITPPAARRSSGRSGRQASTPLFRRRPVLVAGGTMLVLALVLILMATGTLNRFSSTPAETAAAPQAGSPTTQGQYLEALDLLGRWEKGQNLSEAIDLLKDSVKRDPSFALGHARLAEGYRLESALTRDPEMLKLARESAERAAELNDRLPVVQTTLGKVYSALNQNDLALAALQRALELDKVNGEARVALGRVYERLDRLEEAEAAYEQGVALQPDDWQNHFLFGSFHFRRGRFADAVGEWRRVMELTPDNTLALTNLGSALLELGRLPEAQTAYEQVIALEPNYTAFMNLGKVYFLSGRFDEAAQMFEKAVAASSNDYVPVGNLAAAYRWAPARRTHASGTFRRAADLAETRAKAEPTNPAIFADLGLYYAQLGDETRARRRLTTALALDESHPGVQAAAAEAYEVLGDRVSAVRHARRAIELGYRKEELRRNPELAELVTDDRLANATSPVPTTP